ncbi:MAG: histidine kinase dimerization/phospho-acceptor domain-containing protein, partial [bacterium]
MGRAIAQQVRLSRLQTDFVSNISHELRTPLTSIRLFIETLQSGRVKDPERVAECLDIIATESDRLSRKIERVLTWARMEAGRRVYEMEVVRPVDLVRAAL